MRRAVVPLLLLLASTAVAIGARQQDGPRFRGGVDLVNVAAWVTDGTGRFVSGLRQDDFAVFEDGVRQEVTYFSNERVPVSLGLALDTSGSMTPDKMAAARSAIDRFIHDLLGPDDELFFLEFAGQVRLVQEWTSDRTAISRAVGRVRAGGGTALYDAVAEAVPLASVGKHPKRAILVISDGNDTNSLVGVGELREIIRESDVLVYALGVDGSTEVPRDGPTIRFPVPRPLPFPPVRGQDPRRRRPPIIVGRGNSARPGDRVDADALRRITDDTGGRTEVVRGFGDLAGATARIADELSKQYFLGYASPAARDGRWHDIRVDVRGRGLSVRARRGYVAS